MPTWSEGYLKTRGQDIVDATGKPILLRGVGLGNWLLPEGYMWKFGHRGDRPRRIEALIEEFLTLTEANQFWDDFRNHYIQEADIEEIARLGFNSVRPALNARLLMTEGENPVFVEEEFERLDRLIAWCKKYELYVILDMHGAPGGQTGRNIDDSRDDRPDLFLMPENKDRLQDLWVKLAKRYRDEPTVAGYDLLNEPLPHDDRFNHLLPELEPLYQRLTKAIRVVDPHHMIILEGANWSNDWSVFSEPFDNNVVYQFHYYCWNVPEKINGIGHFLEKREQWNVPVWVGETGEQTDGIHWGTLENLETHNIGWSFWPWKKLDTRNSPYSIKKPEGWDALAAYSQGGEKPDPQLIRTVLKTFLDYIKLSQCEYQEEVVQSLFRRIPARLEAENFGFDGRGYSYHVRDDRPLAQNYRTEEHVPVVVLQEHPDRRTSDQAVLLSKGEWLLYFVNNPEARQMQVGLRIQNQSKGSKVRVVINNVEQWIVTHNFAWQDQFLEPVLVQEGPQSIRITVLQGSILLDYMTFN